MLVKVSYFPNWHASGADGPWRVTPNLMVVVPTSHDVTLTYGGSSADTLGLLAPLIGLVALLAALRRPDRPALVVFAPGSAGAGTDPSAGHRSRPRLPHRRASRSRAFTLPSHALPTARPGRTETNVSVPGTVWTKRTQSV